MTHSTRSSPRLENRFRWGSDRRLASAAVWLIAILAALHPIGADGLWWELSKGRAVVAGSWQPTSDLLAGTTGPEADWLSGVPAYLIASMLGMWALMAAKLFIVLGMARFLLKRGLSRGDADPWGIAGLVAIALVGSHAAWEPVPLLWDALGLVLLLRAVESLPETLDRRSLAIPAVLLAAWANLGPRFIVGAVLSIGLLARRRNWKALAIGSLVFLASGSLTPAGIRGWVDSAVVTFPQLVERTAILRLAGWQPWWDAPLSAEAIAIVLFTLVGLWRIGRDTGTGYGIMPICAAHVLAAASSENGPLAVLLLVLHLTSPVTGTVSAVGRSVDVTRPVRRWPGLPGKVAAVLALLIAIRPWSQTSAGMGWGIDPRIDPTAFAASVAETQLSGTAHCVGSREAGLVAWLGPPRLQPFDTPTSALLHHRLEQHVLLTQDLSREWRLPRRRVNGDWGGWSEPVRDRELTALVIPSERVDVIAALEPTVWKPLSLNAVSLVYGKAGNPASARQIVQILSLRGFVDLGSWTYDPASEVGAETWELASHRSMLRGGLRLAGVFRAMDLNFAALKVLGALSASDVEQVRQEFASNQAALGYRERKLCGRGSLLRFHAARMADPVRFSSDELEKILNWGTGAAIAADPAFLTGVAAYLAGHREEAIAAFRKSPNRPEAGFAEAMMDLEGGNPKSAGERLRQLRDEFPDHHLARVAAAIADTLAD